MNGDKVIDCVIREMELGTIDGFSLSRRPYGSRQPRMEVWKETAHAAYDVIPECSDMNRVFDHIIAMIKEVSYE